MHELGDSSKKRDVVQAAAAAERDNPQDPQSNGASAVDDNKLDSSKLVLDPTGPGDLTESLLARPTDIVGNAGQEKDVVVHVDDVDG